MSEPVIRARGLRKIFTQGPFEVPVLLGIDLDVGKGESVAIVESRFLKRFEMQFGYRCVHWEVSLSCLV